MVSILLDKAYDPSCAIPVNAADTSPHEQDAVFMHPPKLIVATDGDAATLDLLQDNISTTGSSIVCSKLYWGDLKAFIQEFPEPFDVLLAADVIYEDEQVEPLVNTVATILRKPHGVFYLAFARRNVPIDKVISAANNLSLKESVLDQNGMEPIYAFTWR